MTAREIEEYRELRATIRERGTTRVWVVLAGLTAWAVLAMASAAFTGHPAATLIPLIVLATTFELVLALHVGVERIGRYLQVFFEEGPPTEDAGRGAAPGAAPEGWEHHAMEYGRRFPAGGDALFSLLFIIATALNLSPLFVAGPGPVELVLSSTGHGLFAARLFVARRASARQRQVDLERFRLLKQPR